MAASMFIGAHSWRYGRHTADPQSRGEHLRTLQALTEQGFKLEHKRPIRLPLTSKWIAVAPQKFLRAVEKGRRQYYVIAPHAGPVAVNGSDDLAALGAIYRTGSTVAPRNPLLAQTLAELLSMKYPAFQARWRPGLDPYDQQFLRQYPTSVGPLGVYKHFSGHPLFADGTLELAYRTKVDSSAQLVAYNALRKLEESKASFYGSGKSLFSTDDALKELYARGQVWVGTWDNQKLMRVESTRAECAEADLVGEFNKQRELYLKLIKLCHSPQAANQAYERIMRADRYTRDDKEAAMELALELPTDSQQPLDNYVLVADHLVDSGTVTEGVQRLKSIFDALRVPSNATMRGPNDLENARHAWIQFRVLDRLGSTNMAVDEKQRRYMDLLTDLRDVRSADVGVRLAVDAQRPDETQQRFVHLCQLLRDPQVATDALRLLSDEHFEESHESLRQLVALAVAKQQPPTAGLDLLRQAWQAVPQGVDRYAFLGHFTANLLIGGDTQRALRSAEQALTPGALQRLKVRVSPATVTLGTVLVPVRRQR